MPSDAERDIQPVIVARRVPRSISISQPREVSGPWPRFAGNTHFSFRKIHEVELSASHGHDGNPRHGGPGLRRQPLDGR
jgi:hypothetical protein